ncbi:hypothetical protein CEE37_07695 [candidate division LCP-89 bacterium B3_LCP]|uniref:Alginate export domain-containing protein n=1 Tax=candidate division LCP-89 bacterium B3_LCP TaxID=2012998 RepID=A0A532V0U4_UNCL8|nr:MAG: hypothetical protein CEE37_07695 [candidate division LCP-89 bacterium B3_LCP]
MSRDFLTASLTKNNSLIPLIIVSIILLTSTIQAADFQGSLKFRWDEGQEVDPRISSPFPDNLTDRRYIEGLLTAEVLFKKLPVGKRLRLGLRLLELQPSDVDGVIYGLEEKRRFDDKIYAQWKYKKWEVWAGDVTETFGKGLALNLFENRDLYFDSSLRGGKVSYKSKALRFKAIYGQSRAGYLVEMENVAGANLEYRPRRNMQFGASLVHQEGLFYQKYFMPEVYAGLDIGPISFFGEYAQRRPDNGDIPDGEGTYVSLGTSFMGLAAQVGYKYYQFGADNPFQTPPIAQREYTTHLLSQHPHLPLLDDQIGFEIDVSASPSDMVFLTLNFNRSSKHDGGSLIPSLKEDFNPFWELFLESEIYPRPDLTLKIAAGQNEEARSLFWQRKTATLAEAIYSFSNLWSVTGDLESMWVDDKELGESHNEQWFALTLSRASWGSVNFSYEQSSLHSDTEGDNWMGVEIAADVKRNHRLMLFYGRERGGLKCTSGVCRPVQPFEGFRLTYDARF